jgi:integrase
VRAFLASLKGAERRDGRGAISDSTAAYVGTVLRIALAEATKRGLLQRNPATHIRRPKVEPAEMLTWTAEEAQAFELSVRGDRLHALWLLALALGMRRGELLGSRWLDVDLDAGQLSVRQQLLDVKDGRPTFGPPKTKRSTRRLSLDPRLVAALRARRRAQLEERLAWGEAWTDTGLVFTRENGAAISPMSLSLAIGRLATRAGIRPIRFHDLRHTSASLALQANQHPAVVAARLGHSVGMLLETYSHVLETVASEAASEVAGLVIGKTLTGR